jgi:MFS family permease
VLIVSSEAGLTEGRIGCIHAHSSGRGDLTGADHVADRFGRKRTLILGALLMAGAGVAFILTRNVILLIAAAIIGVISPSGNEIGPFLSVEQAGLTQLISNQKRTQFFAWYNLAGSFATATGALAGGWLAQGLQDKGWAALESYRVVMMGYALGGLLSCCFTTWPVC